MKNRMLSFMHNHNFNRFATAIMQKYTTCINSESNSSDILKLYDEIALSTEFPGIEMINEFLSSVCNHEVVIPAGNTYYRCRIVNSKDVSSKLQIVNNQVCGLPADESSAPPPKSAKAGRANPQGVPYLYLASDKYTAISEVEPYNKSVISVAKFELVRDMKLVNLVYEGKKFSSSEEVSSVANEFYRIESLSFSFSKPCGLDNEEQYAPTQYIAHQIKHLTEQQYDGMAYNSLKSNGGINIVLFDKNLVRFCDSELVICYGMEYNIQNVTYITELNPRLEKKFVSPSQSDIKAVNDMIKRSIESN